MVIHEDENGKWGVDKDNWCGILEPEVYSTTTKKKTTTTKKTTTKTTTTKSKTTTTTTTIKKITTTTSTKKTTTTKTTTTKKTTTTTKKPVETDDCWSLVKGYPCCEKGTAVNYVDKDGKWGLQKNLETKEIEWCGIIDNGDITTSNTTKSSVKPTTTTTTKRTTTTTKRTTTTTTTNNPKPTVCVDNYGQCGGINYNGPSCCKEGFYCKAYSDYYHQCIPKSF
jgi:hypothetical protein